MRNNCLGGWECLSYPLPHIWANNADGADNSVRLTSPSAQLLASFRRLWYEVVDPGSIPGISTIGALWVTPTGFSQSEPRELRRSTWRLAHGPDTRIERRLA
jgi:hypothetical protein